LKKKTEGTQNEMIPIRRSRGFVMRSVMLVDMIDE
jgi:hypothetical protein